LTPRKRVYSKVSKPETLKYPKLLFIYGSPHHATYKNSALGWVIERVWSFKAI